MSLLAAKFATVPTSKLLHSRHIRFDVTKECSWYAFERFRMLSWQYFQCGRFGYFTKSTSETKSIIIERRISYMTSPVATMNW